MKYLNEIQYSYEYVDFDDEIASPKQISNRNTTSSTSSSEQESFKEWWKTKSNIISLDLNQILHKNEVCFSFCYYLKAFNFKI